MDGNSRPKPQTRARHSRRGRDQASSSQQYSSSEEEDFHSDDNLRPYEEVKVAHHNKKLSGLGLTPDETAVSPLDKMDHSTRLYSYLSGSDGDIETDNPLSPQHHHQQQQHHHQKWDGCSQSSVSSEELCNHPRDSRISHLTLSDSDGENELIQTYNRGGNSQIPPPTLPPPPPPPPIEDIPQRVPPVAPPRQFSQKVLGPSYRGNYSDVETARRGNYSDVDSRRGHYSEGEPSEFDFLVQTSSGNVFIPPDFTFSPDAQPRFPRTVPRAGTVPLQNPNQSLQGASLDGYPLQYHNADQQMQQNQNVTERQAFSLPQFGATPTIPMSSYPGVMNDSTYYSKFSSASHRMKKQLKRRCSWKCTALILLLLCVALLAVVAYFATLLMLEEEERVDCSNTRTNLHGAPITNSTHGSGWPTSRSYKDKSGAMPTRSNVPSAPAYFRVGERQHRTIPPKSFWNTQFSQNEAAFVKFNFSISNSAIIGVYGRKSLPPTPVQFDFFEVLEGKTLPTRQRRAAEESDASSAFMHHLESGNWFISIYNDDEEPQVVSFIGEFDKMNSGCPSDCHGHGECNSRQCDCYPGFSSFDCSQKSCPILCNGNGMYVRGRCQCHPGWKGQECELREDQCTVPNCNGNGRCIDGECVCMQGFTGSACQEVDCTEPSCSGNGICLLGQCKCFRGHKGSDCSMSDRINITQVCTRDCSGHGIYSVHFGKCTCEKHFKGENCEEEICRLECSQGYCKNQRCVCYAGWTGALCDQVACDHRCDNHGFCNNGTCVCNKGWHGKHCTLDGCPNDCSNNGDCLRFTDEWRCNCRSGWKGTACDIAMETQCSDKQDNDDDGLTDCLDPDCCVNTVCMNSIHCQTSPNPLEILLRKQPPSTTASFYEKMRFLIEESSVQSYATKNAFNESQVSVIRGKVMAKDGSALVGVRVGVVTQPLFGFTLTREQGLFDILVNGGGSVDLQFMRQPFRTKSASVLVPWNQIITMDTVVMTLEVEDIAPDPASCSMEHEHYWLRPVVLSTWQHTQLGACPDKSTIIPESQVLQESLSIPGTDVHLVYHSSETAGYMSVILIQMTPDTIPESLALVHLRVSVEGVVQEKLFEADPGLKYTFSWDRRNAYKMKVYGIVTARVYVGYKYVGCDYVFWETRSTTMSGYDLTSSEIGGWNLDIHHTYNFQEGILHKGDGTNIYLKEKPKKLTNVLGNGRRRSKLDCDGCNGKAVENRLMDPVALASGLDGSLYVGDYNFVRKLSPNREEVASILQMSTAKIPYRYFMTVSPVDGRLYISASMTYQIIRVKTMGPVRDLEVNFEVVAGNGDQCTPGETDKCGDGGQALEARLMNPKGIAINKDGIIYVADGPNIRLITTDGKIQTLIGSQEKLKKWTPLPCDKIMSADKVSLRWPTALAISPLDDTLHILDNNIVLQLTKDHKLVTIAGRPIYCPPKQTSFLPQGVLTDDEQASSIADHVTLVKPESITFGPHGDLFLVESDTHHINRVRVVSTDGHIHHYAGAKSRCDCQKPRCKCYDPKENLAAQALFSNPTSVTVTPDGVLHIADSGNYRVHSVVSELPQSNDMGDYEVFSTETQEVFVFNRFGQHKTTVSVMTSQHMYTFTYNVGSFYGKLVKVTDSDSNSIQLRRDFDMQVQEIIPPNGQKCRLSMDNMQRLHRFVSPENMTAIFTYMTSAELLETKQMSDGKLFFYEYDDTGRLLKVTQPTGEVINLTTDVNTTGSIVHISTDNHDAVAMATYGSVQSVMHGEAETKVTYLPDGAVVVLFPSNLTVALETSTHPVLESEHRMHFKRKVVLPNTHVHRLEWRYYLRRDGRSRKSRIINKIGRRTRVGGHYSQHALVHESHDEGYKGKMLLVNGENLLTVEYDRDTHSEAIFDKDAKEMVTIVYDDNGLPTHFLPSEGHHSMNISYNQFGAITSWQYGDLQEKRKYNDRGLLTEKELPNSAQYRYIYRSGYKPTDVILPSGKQYLLRYDYLGNLMEVTMPGLGRHTFAALDTITFQRSIYNPPDSHLPYIEDYDASGKLVRIIYPSEDRHVSYRYNSILQPLVILFDEAEVRFEYNKAIRKLSMAEVMQRTYGCQQQYQYNGALVSQFDLKFLLDHQLLAARFRYDYDNNFHLISINAWFSNNLTTVTNFSYNKHSGQLDSVKDIRMHKPLQDREMVHDKYVKFLKEYDNYGRLKDVQLKFDDKIQFMLQIDYDTANRVHQWKLKVGQTESRAYEYIYDIDNNIIEVKLEGQPSWKYKYDANSNIVKITQSGHTSDLSFDAGDHISQFGEKRYKFDKDGFMVQRGDQFIQFNSLGQLMAVSKIQLHKVLFYYDADGRLVAFKDSIGNVMQYFHGDIQKPYRVTHTYNHTTRDLTQYHYDSAGKLLSMERKGSIYYIATDPDGTPIVLFDTRGYVVKQLHFDPLGLLKKDSNTDFEIAFGFQAGIYNKVANLIHFKSRVYDPEIGRWLSPDYRSFLSNIESTLESPKLMNMYQYQDLVNLHNIKNPLPVTDVSDWLKMLGFDFRSLAPDISYMGEIHPIHEYSKYQLLPSSSAFECTFRRDMDNILTLTNVPRSKVTPDQSERHGPLMFKYYHSILGKGVTLSVKDGKVLVNMLDNVDDETRKIASVLLNNSLAVGLRFTIRGKDEHFYIKQQVAQADIDKSLIGFHKEKLTLDNGMNVTFRKVFHSDGFRGRTQNELDIRLHGNHSVINIRYGTTVEREHTRVLQHAEQRAIKHAWDREKQFVQQSLPSDYKWTEQEKEEIVTGGYADGYEAEYIRDPVSYPELADDCNNIRFYKRT